MYLVSYVLAILQLFSSMVAGLFLNMLMSAIKGHPEDMSSPGLVSFGYLGVSVNETIFKTVYLSMRMLVWFSDWVSERLRERLN